ncbi:MAG: tripartite tricarboxylate transporter substrate binding protein [Betaproteobacteria bacterium]|nr:tripartite tricarboxylate transporter substrate binding protein [Betaproteobacteria bacterium]
MIKYPPHVVATAVVVACFSIPAAISAYPERPIRYIVPAAAGSGPDIIARILTAELGRQMGQQFVVDNRPGGAGTIGMDMMVRAAPDGHTIGFGTILTLAINRSVLAKLPYDPDRDLLPIVQYTSQPNLLAVTPSLPVKSVRELINYAKKNPGKLLYASGGNASSPHLSGELFKFMTGIDMVHVPYKGLVLAMTDLTQGRVQLMFGTLAAIAPAVKAGKLRGVAVTSPKRTPIFPELPTVAEAGVPGFEVVAWDGAIAPARVPKAVVARLNAEMNKALALASVREKLAGLGVEVVGGTSEQFAEHIRKESVKWAEVVKRAGVKVD